MYAAGFRLQAFRCRRRGLALFFLACLRTPRPGDLRLIVVRFFPAPHLCEIRALLGKYGEDVFCETGACFRVETEGIFPGEEHECDPKLRNGIKPFSFLLSECLENKS